MTRALLKKQMMEVFSWVYKDNKSGKLRSSKGIAGYAILYLVIFGFLGIVFGFAASMLCKPLLSVGMGWLYWCLMGLISIFFGVFGSVFNTYSSLYQAKDNDLLLAMPIPASRILFVRLSGVYMTGLMYELISMIPTVIIWFTAAPFSFLGAVNTVLIPFVLSLLILVLSAALGWVVALIATKLKRKNIITVFISLAFFAAYYYFNSQASSILQSILSNAEAVGNKLRTVLFPLYHMGLAAEGRPVSMLIFTSITAALTAAAYAVLSGSFLKLATTNRGSAKVIYKEKTTKSRSVGGALLQKELRRFTGSANYMLNCGLGIVLMPIAAAAAVWKAPVIREVLSFGSIKGYAPLLAVAAVCLLSAMNDMTAPSVSLEGKNLWIVQSFPVSAVKVLKAKLVLQFILTLIPAMPLIAVLEWLLMPEPVHAVMIFAISALFIVLMAEIGLALNLKMPNLNWNSEIVPIKQSMCVMLTLFGGWAIVAAIAGLYAPLMNFIGLTVYFILIFVLLTAAIAALSHWLFTKGARIFETL